MPSDESVIPVSSFLPVPTWLTDGPPGRAESDTEPPRVQNLHPTPTQDPQPSQKSQGANQMPGFLGRPSQDMGAAPLDPPESRSLGHHPEESDQPIT